MNIVDTIKSLAILAEPVGSRVTCSPPPSDTDEDYLMLIRSEQTGEMLNVLTTIGFEIGGSRIPDGENAVPPDGRFVSLRLGELNVILTESKAFFLRFMTATSVAKRLNIQNKLDRIALFQAVLYGNSLDDLESLPSESGALK